MTPNPTFRPGVAAEKRKADAKQHPKKKAKAKAKQSPPETSAEVPEEWPLDDDDEDVVDPPSPEMWSDDE